MLAKNPNIPPINGKRLIYMTMERQVASLAIDCPDTMKDANLLSLISFTSFLILATTTGTTSSNC